MFVCIRITSSNVLKFVSIFVSVVLCVVVVVVAAAAAIVLVFNLNLSNYLSKWFQNVANIKVRRNYTE